MLDWFARSYSVEVLDGAPLIAPPRVYVFPKRVEDVERGALHVMVRPAADPSWLGVFALGYSSPHTSTGVFATPHPDRFLAVSGGYAYLANANMPEQTKFLKQQPIVWVGHCASPPLLLLADQRSVTAVDASGVAWQTAPLSMEGLTDLKVADNCLHGKGWNAITDEETSWTVALETGTVC